MPIHHITGNALDFPENTNVLLNIVSLKPVMGAGIARQIAEEYPDAFQAHKDFIAGGTAMLGEFSSAIVAAGTKRICNLIAQADIGTHRRQLDYEALYSGLTIFRELLTDAYNNGRVYRVAMPWVGTGLAGGSRKVVGAMIEDIFENAPFEVFVVDYKPKTSVKSADTPTDLTESPAMSEEDRETS